jgi:AraC-like DNA-binding protein
VNTVNLTASRHAFPVATFLADHGEPLQPLFQRAGLPGTCLDDPKKLVPTAAIWRFRELAAMRTGSPNLTLTVMAPLALSELGAVGEALSGASTLLRTIQDFQRLAHSESSTATLDLRPCHNGDSLFSVRFSLRYQPGEWQAELCLLMWMLKVVWLVDPEWSPTEIWCAANGTPDRLRAIESLAARARFNRPCTGFPIPASMLALPQQRCGRRTETEEALLWSTAPSESTSGAVSQVIQAYADDRWLTIAEASDALGVHPRALQRRLAAEGKTFSAVLEEVRAEVAGRLLEDTDASVCEIARQVGYSNSSNFNRAFRRWAAVLPSEFRTQRRAEPRPSRVPATSSGAST